MIGVDAAGPRSLRYGTIGDHVERLRVVFANGEIAELGFAALARPSTTSRPTSRTWSSASSHNVHRQSRQEARPAPPGPAAQPRRAMPSPRPRDEPGIDLARLVGGSEGTLALVTEAVLRTVPIPAAQGVVVLPFGRLGDAAGGGARLPGVGLDPSACDLYDWRRSAWPATPIPGSATGSPRRPSRS